MGAEQSYQKSKKEKKDIRKVEFYIGSETTDIDSNESSKLKSSNDSQESIEENVTDEVEQKAQELYNCLINDRLKLPDIIHNMSFIEMKAIIERIENDHFADEEFRNKSVWSELCLGKKGRINNKQMSLYEIPTKELIDTIISIVNDIGAAKIEEMCAGMGLLSSLLQRRGVIVKATDGNSWVETFAPKRYVNVEEKLLIEYNINKDVDDSTLYIGSWPVPSSPRIKDFVSFVKDTRPKYYLFIGENRRINRTNESMYNFMLENGYVSFELFPGQISYKDYFCSNYSKYCQSQQRSSTILFVDKNKAPNFKLEMEKYSTVNNVAYETKNYIQDMIVEGVIPHCYLNIPYTDAIISKVDSRLHSKTNINPDIFETVEEYEFFLKKSYPIAKFPKIRTRKEFLEYKEMIGILESEGGYQRLIDSGYFPQWMETSPENIRPIAAEQYIFVDFSTESKAWKETPNTFATEFTKISQSFY